MTLPGWIVVHLDPIDPNGRAYAIARLVVNDRDPVYTATEERYHFPVAARIARQRRERKPP